MVATFKGGSSGAASRLWRSGIAPEFSPMRIGRGGAVIRSCLLLVLGVANTSSNVLSSVQVQGSYSSRPSLSCFLSSSIPWKNSPKTASSICAPNVLALPVFAPRSRSSPSVTTVAMSKKDKRYKLAKRGQNEDELLLTVAEQFRRREGQAQISWYPGHIAKAEKRLQEVLSAVDVVVEVRDARIPISTTHPIVDNWLKNRNTKRVVCVSKIDMAPRSAMSMWKAYLENSLEIPVAFMNCKEGGKGLIDLKKIVKRMGHEINERRALRDMRPRNVRVAVIGYPNVGKSALLNRLAGKVKAKSENRAGVTKALQWSRVEGFDLLDSPGIIPAKLLTQEIAVHLAICDDIGSASYDTILVAAALIDEVRKVGFSLPSYVDLGGFYKRYQMHVGTMSGEEYIFRLAQNKFLGLELQAAERVLDDWRKGRLGLMALEPPPAIPYHTGYYRSLGLKKGCDARVIKSAYRDKARVLHPDVGGDPNEWTKVNNAYAILSDASARKRYDEHGLIWDIQVGNYRVLNEGEEPPTIRSVATSMGTKLLSAGGGWRPVAKVRKGRISMPLISAGGAQSSILTKPPSRPAMRRRKVDGAGGRVVVEEEEDDLDSLLG